MFLIYATNIDFGPRSNYESRPMKVVITAFSLKKVGISSVERREGHVGVGKRRVIITGFKMWLAVWNEFGVDAYLRLNSLAFDSLYDGV